MPRTYTPVANKKHSYTSSNHDDLEKAANDVKKGVLSYRKACEKYNVKKTTLQDYVKNGGVKKIGRPTLLTAEAEKV